MITGLLLAKNWEEGWIHTECLGTASFGHGTEGRACS